MDHGNLGGPLQVSSNNARTEEVVLRLKKCVGVGRIEEFEHLELIIPRCDPSGTAIGLPISWGGARGVN